MSATLAERPPLWVTLSPVADGLPRELIAVPGSYGLPRQLSGRVRWGTAWPPRMCAHRDAGEAVVGRRPRAWQDIQSRLVAGRMVEQGNACGAAVQPSPRETDPIRRSHHGPRRLLRWHAHRL